MTEQSFSKVLTANDTGASGGHQAGIHIPKTQRELIAFLPELDPETKNPSVWLDCTDDAGGNWQFRYIYYNNKLHDPEGTRNEYRITHMTAFMRSVGARPGQVITISGVPRSGVLTLAVSDAGHQADGHMPRRIRLKGWHRVY